MRIVCPEPDRHASQCNVDVEEESPDDVWRSMVSWTTGSVRPALGAFISERWQLCQAHVSVFLGRDERFDSSARCDVSIWRHLWSLRSQRLLHHHHRRFLDQTGDPRP